MLISDLSSDVCSSDLLPSNFALKIHALLCRGFLKGRDWFDFSWYVAKGVTLNLALLSNALIQAGLWAGDNHIAVDMPLLNGWLGRPVVKLELGRHWCLEEGGWEM